MSLTNRNILLGITGGIAAYKAAELARLLIKQGARVRVVMTKAAKAFIQPMTFQALTGHRVYDDLLDDQTDNAMAHIDLARWADMLLVAPASADFLARVSLGLANDLLATLCLATQARCVFAPAMNQQMWLNAATQEHVSRLLARGVTLLGPGHGEQACGDMGPGRLLEPEMILSEIQSMHQPAILSGQHWVITAGPTQEAIDPVRYLSNHSSGKMGYALATAAAALGAEVTLVSGPTALSCPVGVQRVSVLSAIEMQQAVMVALPQADGLIAAAAVADFRPRAVASQKIKKTSADKVIELVTNPDIVAEAAQQYPNCFVVGFALETQSLYEYACKKLEKKGLDAIVANQLVVGETFGGDHHQVSVLTPDGQQQDFERQTKQQLAYELLHYFHQQRLSLACADIAAD